MTYEISGSASEPRRNLNPEPAVAASKDRETLTRSENMNRYQPSPFRPAFGVAAVSLSAVTLAMAVVLPMSFAPCRPIEGQLATAPAATQVSIVPVNLDAVAAPIRTVTLEPINVVARRVSQPS
jgi:hypothetical protein